MGEVAADVAAIYNFERRNISLANGLTEGASRVESAT